MDGETWETLFMADVQEHIEELGVLGIGNFFKANLGKWKDMEISFGVTGVAGVGKSSFINAIRGLEDGDEGAAPAGISDTTRKAAVYIHPTNSKIHFWDLPGIGTPDYPDLESYCRKVGLEKYDTFLILTSLRFTENDRLLVQKVKSLGKSFFLVRTRIDIDYQSESRKELFKENTMLKTIRSDLLDNLKCLENCDEVPIFLISNHYPAKWDFSRLTEAIIDSLRVRQREGLTLSIRTLTSLSTDMVRRKAEVLRGRIWMVASASAAAAAVPLPGLNIAVDLAMITQEMNLYKSQLGLTELKLRKMSPEDQEKFQKFCITNVVNLATRLTAYSAGTTIEKFARFIPFIGSAMAGGISFACTYSFLHKSLDELEKIAVRYVAKAASTESVID